MSQHALARTLETVLKTFKEGLKKELNLFEQSTTFDRIAIRSALAKEYKIKDPKILDSMVDFILKDARQSGMITKDFRQGTTVGSPAYSTAGSKTQKTGKISTQKDRYAIFGTWKNAMSGRFHSKFDKQIGTVRDSATPRGGKNPKTNRSYKSPRTVNRAIHLGHGAGEAYPRVAYPILGALFAGMQKDNWSSAEPYVFGIMKSFKSIEALTLSGTVEKEIDVSGSNKGHIKDLFVVYMGLQGADENLAEGIFEQAEFGRDGILVQKLEEAVIAADMSSASTMKNLDLALTAAILEKGRKKYKTKAKAKVKHKNKGKPKTAGRKPKIIPPLRTSGGQFTSAMNIQAILDAKIKDEVAENMGKGGALVYRTGRFADSVTVDKVMQSRQGALTAYYTYMKAPYQTFERGFKQGSLRRDPRKLISSSIREIARENLSHKLHIRTRRV